MMTQMAKTDERRFNLNGRWVPVRTLDEGRVMWLSLRDAESLGASDMVRGCGEYREGGRVVAHVAYNGRMWVGAAREWTSATQEIK